MDLRKVINNKFGYDVGDLAPYVEERDMDLLTKAVLGGRSTSLFRIQEGVKGKEKLKFLDTTITFQDGSACLDPTSNASGDTTFTDKNIETTPISVVQDFCNEDLVGNWTQLALEAGAHNQNEELAFEEQIVNYIIMKIATEKEKAIHRSDSTLSSGNFQFFDGLVKILKADANVVDGTAGTNVTNVTNSNAFQFFLDIHDQIPEQIIEESDLGIFCPYEYLKKLRRDVQSQNLFHHEVNAQDKLQMELPGTGVTVYALPGLNDQDYVFAARRSNIVIGADLQSDDETFRVWYSQDKNKIYGMTTFRVGVQFGHATEIVDWSGTSS